MQVVCNTIHMKELNDITYYIGYEDLDGFWCSTETSDSDKAIEIFFEQRKTNPKKNWCIYKKTTTIKKVNQN